MLSHHNGIELKVINRKTAGKSQISGDETAYF